LSDARQVLWRIDSRIEFLETLVGGIQGKSIGTNHADYLRNERGIAEFKWSRVVLANGGVEPIEWAPELEPSAEAMEVRSWRPPRYSLDTYRFPI